MAALHLTLLANLRAIVPQHALAAAATPGLLDDLLSAILRGLIFFANLAGGIVIGVATIRALLVYAVDLFRARAVAMPNEAIRLSLGRSLSLALEFQLAADILGTALNPSPSDIATLAAIAALRTALNYFLARELRAAQVRAEVPASAPDISGPPGTRTDPPG